MGSLLLASKVEDVSPPEVDDFLSITDNQDWLFDFTFFEINMIRLSTTTAVPIPPLHYPELWPIRIRFGQTFSEI